MIGLAGQAKAYFAEGDLIRVMYDSKTGVEVVTDLGSLSSLATQTNYTKQADNTSNTIAVTTFGGSAVWSDVNTAYFAFKTTAQDVPVTLSIAGNGTMKTNEMKA